jgi:NitT/TauT family transport system permease protein
MRVLDRLSWKSFLRGLGGILLLLVIWEFFARSGIFSVAITPPLEDIFGTMRRMLTDGSMVKNSAYTLGRVLLGLAISFAIAVPLGVLMARHPLCERFFLPLVSVLMPIPSLAWVPLFVLWFGIGDFATILVVIYASMFPLIYNVWRGVTAVNPVWVRAATVMGADRTALFRKVIWPGALPYIITGGRLAFGRAWIGVIGGELLASPKWGLGEVIFNAKEFLDADVMISALIMIGILGMFFERFVFQRIEAVTVRRWGMVASARD